MRIIIYGLGAIGGVVAVGMANAGIEVIGIARGRMLEAVQKDGLTLFQHDGSHNAKIACVGHPSEITFQPDDMILMCMKGQDMLDALLALRAAGVADQPIFCCQNGVNNEPLALRFFPNVHGVTVMMPATLVEPGKVVITVAPRYGMFDVGRFPGGQDADDQRFADALRAGNVEPFLYDNVMESKYGKLLMNLMNVVQAALGTGVNSGDLRDRVVAEARAVYQAAGITSRDVDGEDARRDEFMKPVEVEGHSRTGGSTWQSLMRGTGSIETDYMNGEIALLARLHGVEAPLNAGLQKLGAKLLAEGAKPGSMTLGQLEDWLANERK